MITQEIRITLDNAGRVDRVIQTLTGRSRAQVRGLIQHQTVKINGEPCGSDFDRVNQGDLVTVTHDPRQNYPDKPQAPGHAPFHLLFEDDYLLVVDKPAHLLTVPTAKRESKTLVHLLQAYVSRGRRRLGRVEIVHRLDRGVSGVLVFAKNGQVAEMLREQFAASKPERDYIGLVAGRVAADQGTFDKNLVTDEETIHRRVADEPGVGERAITHYRVVGRYPDATRIQVRLETGRRNQIRVHFADAGHPILGDPRYEPEKARHRRWPHSRLALHAATLAFTHPINGKPLRFEAPEPAEFAAFAGSAKPEPPNAPFTGWPQPKPAATPPADPPPAAAPRSQGSRTQGAGHRKSPASKSSTSHKPPARRGPPRRPGHTGRKARRH